MGNYSPCSSALTPSVQAEGTRLQLFDAANNTLRKVYSRTKGCCLLLKKEPMLGAIWSVSMLKR